MLSQTRRKNSLDSQSAFCTHSAVCSLHFVSGLQPAFLTNRYSWHQYSLFLVTVIRTTHPISHKIPVCELIRHFRYFRVKTLLSFCKKLEITYNVSSNPPTPLWKFGKNLIYPGKRLFKNFIIIFKFLESHKLRKPENFVPISWSIWQGPRISG